MRKKIGLAVSCFVACSLFLIVIPAFGALNSPDYWTPDVDSQTAADGFVFAIDVTLGSGSEVGLYDYDEKNDLLSIFTSTSTRTTERLKFFYNTTDNTWDVAIASSFTGSTEAEKSDLTKYGSQIDLGETYGIGFYLDIGPGPDDSFTVLETSDQSSDITFTANGTLIKVANMEHHTVPIPTAMLLLGSGLVGLAGFKRKMDS